MRLVVQAVLVSERITGKGAVQSLDLAVGVPLWEIEPFLAAIVVGLVYVGLRFPKGKRAAVVKVCDLSTYSFSEEQVLQ